MPGEDGEDVVNTEIKRDGIFNNSADPVSSSGGLRGHFEARNVHLMHVRLLCSQHEGDESDAEGEKPVPGIHNGRANMAALLHATSRVRQPCDVFQFPQEANARSTRLNVHSFFKINLADISSCLISRAPHLTYISPAFFSCLTRPTTHSLVCRTNLHDRTSLEPKLALSRTSKKVFQSLSHVDWTNCFVKRMKETEGGAHEEREEECKNKKKRPIQ